MVSGVPKPQRGGDRGDRICGVLQPPARGLQANPLDVAGRRDTGLGAKGAREVARAHVRLRSHGLDRMLGGDIVDDQPLDFAQRLSSRLLSGKRGAELRLVAGAAQEQHQMTGDHQRGVAIEILLHERQREVHPRGNAGGGPDVAVAQEDRVWVDVHTGMQPRELRSGRPVRGGSAALEQPGARKQKGSRADRGRAPSPSAASRIHSRSGSCAAASREPRPPGTISVSIFWGASARAPSGVRVSPLDVCSGAPSRLNVRTSYPRSPRPKACTYRWAPANTSRGPVTSRLCTPANRRIATWRARGEWLIARS